ncbi:MAG: phosphopantothenoylcysteine decarboxylase [Candidatus Omnitrophota bacterium]
MRILVTAGPTREFIDPVRYISNSSTGYFGYKIAEEAARRGHKVVLITGTADLNPPIGVKTIPVVSAREMEAAVKGHFRRSDCLIMSAAVADYRPDKISRSKIKKIPGKMTLKLVRNPDILSWAGKNKGARVLVGFSVETGDVRKEALKKLRRKNADYIFATMVGAGPSPFGNKKIRVACFGKKGERKGLFSSKEKISSFILDKVEKR